MLKPQKKRGQNIYKNETAKQRIESFETEEHEIEGTKREEMGCLTEQNCEDLEEEEEEESI